MWKMCSQCTFLCRSPPCNSMNPLFLHSSHGKRCTSASRAATEPLRPGLQPPPSPSHAPPATAAHSPDSARRPPAPSARCCTDGALPSVSAAPRSTSRSSYSFPSCASLNASLYQLDATRKLLHAVTAEGAGGKYLIQHSAGSGKTNSIASSARCCRRSSSRRGRGMG